MHNTILPVCRRRDNPQCFHFQFIGSHINIYVDLPEQSESAAKADLVFANDLLPAQFSIAIAEASESPHPRTPNGDPHLHQQQQTYVPCSLVGWEAAARRGRGRDRDECAARHQLQV